MFKYLWKYFLKTISNEKGVAWLLPLALAAAGGAGGYFGTSKKNRKEKGIGNAILGALGGATLGMGAGALASKVATGKVAPALAQNAGGGLLSQAGNITTLGGGKLGLATGILPTAGKEVAKQGILKGFMGSEFGKGMMNTMGGQIAGKILGGGEQEQPQAQTTDVAFPSIPYTEAPIAPMIGNASPLATQTSDWQMQQEILRRRMMGGGYGY